MAAVITKKNNIKSEYFGGHSWVSSTYAELASSKSSSTSDDFSRILAIDSEYIPLDPLQGSKGIDTFDWKTVDNPYERIIHLKDLDTNWDSYGAEKFSRDIINISLSLYSFILDWVSHRKLVLETYQPFIAPCSDNSVLFEWAGNRFPKKSLEIYVFSNNKMEILKYGINDDVEEEFHIGFEHISRISECFDWLADS